MTSARGISLSELLRQWLAARSLTDCRLSHLRRAAELGPSSTHRIALRAIITEDSSAQPVSLVATSMSAPRCARLLATLLWVTVLALAGARPSSAAAPHSIRYWRRSLQQDMAAVSVDPSALAVPDSGTAEQLKPLCQCAQEGFGSPSCGAVIQATCPDQRIKRSAIGLCSDLVTSRLQPTWPDPAIRAAAALSSVCSFSSAAYPAGQLCSCFQVRGGDGIGGACCLCSGAWHHQHIAQQAIIATWHARLNQMSLVLQHSFCSITST